MGVLSPGDLARKLSSNTARMLGLIHKGHLSVGADADISVLDPVKGRAYMGIAAGKIIMIDGTVVGRRGAIISSSRGREAVERMGLECYPLKLGTALPKKTE